MNSIIKTYLIKNKKLTIEGLGVFEVTYKSAEIHPILHTFTAPGEYVVFKKDEKVSSDDFIDFVADMSKITKEEAKDKINKWVAQLKESLKNEKTYQLGSLGSFAFDAVGNLIFNPNLDYDLSPSSYGLENFTFTPDSVNEKAKEDAVAVNTQQTVPYKRKRNSVFYSFIIVLLLLVVALGVYIVLYPNDFVEVKDKMIAKISLWFSTSDKEQIATISEEDTITEETTITTEAITAVISDTMVYTESISPIDSEPEITEEVVKQGNIYIVIGSFKEEKNANVFLQQKKETYSNVVSLGQGKTSNLWLVGLGPYEKMGEAQQFLKENNVNGWILKK
ncbi:MAG TPA: SPOR domain-containing protein [Bacteroidales bacterium]|nr:SPOR domain-containing protein [Bacteroidales bacterium]